MGPCPAVVVTAAYPYPRCVLHGTQEPCLKAVLRNGLKKDPYSEKRGWTLVKTKCQVLEIALVISAVNLLALALDITPPLAASTPNPYPAIKLHGARRATVCLQCNGTSTRPVRNRNYAQAKCTAWACRVNLSGGVSKGRRAEGGGGLYGGQRDAYSPDVDGGQCPPLYAGGTAWR